MQQKLQANEIMRIMIRLPVISVAFIYAINAIENQFNNYIYI